MIDIDVLGSFNAVKATLPHILKSAQRNKDAGQGGRLMFGLTDFLNFHVQQMRCNCSSRFKQQGQEAG